MAGRWGATLGGDADLPCVMLVVHGRPRHNLGRIGFVGLLKIIK